MKNNDLPRVKVLSATKENVNAKTGLGETPLIIASKNGNLEIVRSLLAAKADVDAETTSGATAIFVASKNGYLEVVRNLIGAKADLDVPYKGFLEPTNSDKTKGILVLVTGIFIELFIIWLILNKAIRLARWTKASGQIVRYREELAGYDPDSTFSNTYTIYWPVIAYRDQRSRRFECEPSEATTNRDRYPVGRKMKVAYNPENPSECDVDNTRTRYLWHVIGLFIVAVFIILFGYAMAFGSVDGQGYTALQVASMYGHSDVAQLLKGAGAR